MPSAEFEATLASDASTFAPAMRLLPNDVRADVYSLYQVLCTLDDLVDEDQPGAEQRVDAVERWALGEQIDSPETRVLVDLSRRYPLSTQAVLDGCRALKHDLDRAVIETEDDLEIYSHRAGGTAAIMLAQLLGSSHAGSETKMDTLGRAAQRTNILRDIDEDLAHGRVYIARTTIERFGPPTPGAREQLLRDQIARADALYEDAAGAIQLLSRGQEAVALAAALYREILRQIEREGYGRRPGRVVVPAWRRRLLIARHRLGTA
jgi:phytoene synthase